MSVRRLWPGEGAIYGRIRLEAIENDPENFAADPSDYANFTASDWENVLARRVAFVAFDNEMAVGLASLVPLQLSRVAHRADVTNVYVSPAYRGAGIASQLWHAVEAHASSTGITQLELAVSAENAAALRFYEKKGCVPIGRLPAGMRHQDRFVDEILMVRPLGGAADPS